MDFSLVGLTLLSAILTNIWTDAKEHTAHGCRGGQVRLNCPSGTVLISEVVLADSTCFRGGCCPKPDDCRGAPSVAYRDSVLRSCNGKTSCAVDVEIKSLGCSFLPNNDYARISYVCQEPETTETTLRRRSTSFPVVASSTVTALHSVSTQNNKDAAAAAGVSTARLKTMSEKDEEEEERAEITTSVHDKRQAKVTSPALKSALNHNANEAQRQAYEDDSQPPDRMVTMTSLIVGCVVIVTTVIAAAVVMALKKRRVPKMTTEHPLVASDGLCVSAAGDGGGGGDGGEGGDGGGEENRRNSNIYELIPDIRVGGEGEGGGGGGDGGEGEGRDGDAVKENEYLRPMTDDEERPYFWVP